LAPFKKGAFHLAMQAGVPIVPIVIHNAGDVAPKGDFVFRPATVEVDVLPPVDTSHWRAETINEHVRDIRNMFARTLGQPEDNRTTSKKASDTGTAKKKLPSKKKSSASGRTQKAKAVSKKPASSRKKTPLKTTSVKTKPAKTRPVKPKSLSKKSVKTTRATTKTSGKSATGKQTK
jgi:putative phosphoserine phosphatase/1-acylglycerol-3-phosphate O-acyltransferase